MVDALHSSGVASTDIFDVAGVTPLEQNGWKVQAAVYVSLEASDSFPKARAAAAGSVACCARARVLTQLPPLAQALLPHFHDETNAASLAELRARAPRTAQPRSLAR